MTQRAYDKIAAGLADAIAFAEGQKGRGRVHEPPAALSRSCAMLKNRPLDPTGF